MKIIYNYRSLVHKLQTWIFTTQGCIFRPNKLVHMKCTLIDSSETLCNMIQYLWVATSQIISLISNNLYSPLWRDSAILVLSSKWDIYIYKFVIYWDSQCTCPSVHNTSSCLVVVRTTFFCKRSMALTILPRIAVKR